MADEAGPAVTGREVLARENLRASHEDRDQIVEQLRDAAGDGRLDGEELEQRVEAALTARTYGELAALVADLPVGSAVRVGRPAPRTKDVVRIECRNSNTRREGPWAVPPRVEIVVKHGNVILDFTRAEITRPTVQVDVDLRHGNLILITRPGIFIDADDLIMRSGHARIRLARGPEVPAVLRIDLAGLVHHGNMVARPPYRSFWDWLLRRPHPHQAAPPPAGPDPD
ncbi:MAG TPA: DUF1707 domain-containing protein [Streptosporangiaceae bacterium]|jgi:hypothetical protein